MGESIMEATILSWVKNVGDTIEVDETIIEIATDKVDSEIPSPVAGTLSKILFNVNDVVPIGTVIALIDTGGPGSSTEPVIAEIKTVEAPIQASKSVPETNVETVSESIESDRFYSPLVKNIAKEDT